MKTKVKINTGFNSYVYLIGHDNSVKIGKSNNPDQRLGELQVGNPREILMLGCIGCKTESDALELESKLHGEYSDRKIRGEWFNLSSDEVEYLLLNNTKSRMARIPSDELITAGKDLSPKAYQLLMYYYSKGDRWDWDDKQMAKEMETSIRRIREVRSELEHKDYLLIIKGSITNVFIGREAVMDFKQPRDNDDD